MDFNNMFGKMFGKLASGMCRLSMNGGIAVKTSNGYKTYNVKTGRLTNQDNFVFDIGEEFFFVFPTNKVEKGDIILIGGTPKCVIETDKNKITVIDYEGGEIKTVIPERHVFMGNTYFYGKIISMFGDSIKKGGKGIGNIFKYMAMTEMFKDGGRGGNNNMLPLMLMMNGGANPFGEMFDFDFGDNDAEESDESEEE